MTTPLIRRLTLQNFLSYGPEGVTVDLLPLNVLIGPNASGKSNLLEALAVLRAAAGDLEGMVRDGGGISEFLWKGEPTTDRAALRVDVSEPEPSFTDVISHSIELAQIGTRLEVATEIITAHGNKSSSQVTDGGFTATSNLSFRPLYHNEAGRASIVAVVDDETREMRIADLKSGQSVLSQRRDPELYPELTFLADRFGEVVLFRDWNFGRRSAGRLPQPTDLPSNFLLPDASNLGLVLHSISRTSSKRDELITYLRRFYEPARYIFTDIVGGTLQLFIEEEGGRLIPATRLSDGTLRYLCLLAILLHPNPPPVIGIEEPELGLHPDILPTVAELLKKASERTQLFVTTHSDALVSALSDVPESILVCESMPQGTIMERLEPQKLSAWLEEYRLGEIWRMGELGGNRW